MKQLKRSTLGVAAPFPIANTVHASELLFACLHGVKAISHHLLREANQQRSALPHRLQKSLEEKFSGIIKQFSTANAEILCHWREMLAKKARLAQTGQRSTGLRPAGEQQLLREHTLAAAATQIKPATGWVPLIKTAPARAADHIACAAKQTDCRRELGLAGRCILCVGGRAALYPEYRRVVETAGGSFLTYRGGLQDAGERLPVLLARADAIVCPVDCVNHDIFFAVKRYCQHSGKPCALLERSALPTFCQGIAILASTSVRSATLSTI